MLTHVCTCADIVSHLCKCKTNFHQILDATFRYILVADCMTKLISQGGSVVVDFLFIVTPIVGVCNCSMHCCTLLYVHSSIAIILMEKRELIALLNLSSCSLTMVERLFLAVPWGSLQFVIVVFPDHTHLLFFITSYSLNGASHIT